VGPTSRYASARFVEGGGASLRLTEGARAAASHTAHGGGAVRAAWGNL
jgi:hypothetical protein